MTRAVVPLLREGDQLRNLAHHGPIPIAFASQQISRVGGYFCRAVIERRTIHINDIAEHADEYPVAAALASRGVAAGSGKMLWRANVVVPLMREGEAIGVIGLRRTEPVPFSEGQIELLKTFSDQAVIAIENARLFDEVKAKTRDLTEALEHQTATSEVLSAISRSPTEVQPVFDAIARSATELCGATSGGVDRFDGELIHLASHYNWSPEALRAMGEIYPATPSRGFASARSILTRSVVHIPDISKDPEYTATPVIEVGFRSVLAVPMLRDGQPIGSIALVRLEPRPFTDRQITLLQTFAEQAVIAVNNVRLFDEVQAKTRDLEESLQQQTATADVLKVISRSAFDLRAALHAVLFAPLLASPVAPPAPPPRSPPPRSPRPPPPPPPRPRRPPPPPTRRVRRGGGSRLRAGWFSQARALLITPDLPHQDHPAPPAPPPPPPSLPPCPPPPRPTRRRPRPHPAGGRRALTHTTAPHRPPPPRQRPRPPGKPRPVRRAPPRPPATTAAERCHSGRGHPFSALGPPA